MTTIAPRVEEEAESVIAELPSVGVQYAVAYGSRFAEMSATSHLDVLVVVADDKAEQWHEENLKRNGDHYAQWAKWTGAKTIVALQNSPPGIYFNAMVHLKSEPNLWYKYGVLTMSRLEADLTTWCDLYVAGRLQKPVYTIPSVWSRQSPEVQHKISTLRQQNFDHAIAASLLLLPDEFDSGLLFQTLVSLSYTGDVRVENPQKVKNIVYTGNNLRKFEELYSPSIHDFEKNGIIERVTRESQTLYRKAKPSEEYLVQKLAWTVRQGMATLPKHLPVKQRLETSIRQIVRQSSSRQVVKGFATLGPMRSAQYAGKKVVKMIRGRFG